MIQADPASETVHGGEDQASSLSFGIELESFLITEIGQHIQTKSVLENLLSRSFTDVCGYPGCQVEHITHLKVSTESSDYKSWTVGRDHTLELSAEEKSSELTRVKTFNLPGSQEWCSPLSSPHRSRIIHEAVDGENEKSRKMPGTASQQYAVESKYPGMRYSQDQDLNAVGSLKNVVAWHQVIQKAQTYQHLIDLYTHRTAKHSSFNIQHCTRPEGINTLEFRQHAGTLDYHQVIPWVDATVRIVQWCGGVNQSELSSIIYNQWHGSLCNFVDILELVGAPGNAIEQYDGILNASGKENEKIYNQALMVEHRHEPGDVLTPFVRYVEDERCLARCREAVRKRIDLKYAFGCYGIPTV